MAYTAQQVAESKTTILALIADGRSLKSICDDIELSLPSRPTVYEWIAEDEVFANNYARAREEQADFYADEIIDIADTEPDANKARVRIDARKWKASKMQPKKYGDKIDVNHSGTIEHLTDEQLESRIAVLLGKAGTNLPAGGSGAPQDPA